MMLYLYMKPQVSDLVRPVWKTICRFFKLWVGSSASVSVTSAVCSLFYMRSVTFRHNEIR